MSRRKQSNPKPIKRSSENEDSDSTMEKELSVNINNEADNDQLDETTAESAEKQEPETHENCNKNAEAKSENENIQTDVKRETHEIKMISETSMTDHLKRVSVPNNILFLKKLDDEEACVAGRSYLLFSAIPLPSGSCIGPFKGEIVSLSSIRQGDLVLQAQEKGGDAGFVRVLDENGAWLSLLRPAPSESAKNASVYFEDEKIWCEIVSDLNPGTELLASFTINSTFDAQESVTVKTEPDSASEMETSTPAKLSSPISASSPTAQHPMIPDKPSHAALLYGCQFCGVRFSSLRTLQGHLTFYCSKKPLLKLPLSLEQNVEENDDENDKNNKGNLNRKRRISDRSDSPENKDSPGKTENSTETDATAQKLPRHEVYKCDMCSYSIDKLSSLNRHKRIHNRADIPMSDNGNMSSKQDMYCKYCNIQFSSYSTYKCHKEIYCSKRLSSSDRSSNSSISPGLASPSSDSGRVMLTPNSIQHAMIRASPKSGQTRVILAPPIVVSSKETDLNYGYPTVIVQPVLPESKSPPKVLCSKQSSATCNTDLPLDLSTPKCDVKKELIVKEINSEEKNEEQKVELDLSVKIKEENPKLSLSSTTSPRQMNTTKSSSSSPQSQNSDDTPVRPVPHMLAPGIPPLISVPQLPFLSKPLPQVPHSVSKCVDCNIVFYKRENYLIHKKHYCSSRQSKSSSEDEEAVGEVFLRRNVSTTSGKVFPPDRRTLTEGSNKSPIYTQESSELSNRLQNERETSDKAENSTIEKEELIYRFYCVPCKIKFSSSSTLQAHKEFYCPHGRESEHSVLSKSTDERNESPSPKQEDEIYRCGRCDSIFPSSRLLKLHICSGISNHVPIFRCVYCDFVTQTETRLSEHMKAHMPNKAYRCTICGYRGNTVRGMRMHGKVHLDNGEEFTDDHMIEIEEPPLMPVKLSSMSSDGGPIDVEAELIRLKNEPYKRRRSRKSYEKAEHASSIPTRNISSMCVFCGQMFTDLSNFAMHLKLHEMIALQAAGVQNYKCQYCTVICETFESLMAHVYNKHPEKIPREQNSPTSTSSRCNSRSSLSISKSPEVEQKESKPDIQNNERNDQSRQSATHVTTNDNCEAGCDVDETKVKKELLEDTSDSTGDTENIPENLKIRNSSPNFVAKKVKEEVVESENTRSPLESSSENTELIKSASSSPKSRSPASRGSTPKVKSERSASEAVDKKPPLVIPRIDPQMMPYYHMMLNPVYQLSQTPKRTDKYCRHCDISFTYQNSYLAHKKYYCSANNVSEEITSPAQA